MASTVGTHTLGFVICRPDGCRCACVNMSKLPAGALERDIIQTCTLQHEECHVGQTLGLDAGISECPPGNCGALNQGPRDKSPGGTSGECPCYGSELQCLDSGSRRCAGNPSCQQAVAARLAFVINHMCNTMGCRISSYVAYLSAPIRNVIAQVCPANRQ